MSATVSAPPLRARRRRTRRRLGRRFAPIIGLLPLAADVHWNIDVATLVALGRLPWRGRWGETQLRNVVELAGMLEHCDFVAQASTRDAQGELLRPDLVVRIPGGKHVVVDAKVPLAAYLEGGRWQVQEIASPAFESVESLSHALRQVSGESGAVGMVSVDEDFFV